MILTLFYDKIHKRCRELMVSKPWLYILPLNSCWPRKPGWLLSMMLRGIATHDDAQKTPDIKQPQNEAICWYPLVN